MKIYCGLCDEYNELPTEFVVVDGKILIHCSWCDNDEEIPVIIQDKNK